MGWFDWVFFRAVRTFFVKGESAGAMVFRGVRVAVASG